MLIASASAVVDSGLIPSRVKPITFKLVFTASLLDAQHQRESVKNKPASLLVVMQIWDKSNANIPKSMWFCSVQITFFQHLAIFFFTAMKDLSNLINNNSYGDEDKERL